jgi:acyl-CoA reductase-like NAD-dependent aldehyde dehydrogenase
LPAVFHAADGGDQHRRRRSADGRGAVLSGNPGTTYHTLDEAIVRANKTPFGLSGSVWSRDTEKALAVARSIEAGQVWVNTHGVLAINHLAPYGGVKQSGIGRKSGIEGILEYVHSQTITTYEHA